MIDRTYSIAGLTIVSDVDLPALPAPPDASVDVEFRLVAQRPRLPVHEAQGAQWAIGAGECLIWERDRLALHIAGGNHIAVWVSDPVWIERASVYLVGAALSALAMQRRILALHGSAVNAHGRALLLLAPSGTGKSTAAAAMTTLGCAAIADDVCLPQPLSTGWAMQPVIPSPKVAERTATALACSIWRPTAEGEVRLTIDRRLDPEPVPIGAMLLLRRDPAVPAGITRLTGATAAEQAMRQVYRVENVHFWGRLGETLSAVASLVKATPVYTVDLPSGLERMKDFCRTRLVPLALGDTVSHGGER